MPQPAHTSVCVRVCVAPQDNHNIGPEGARALGSLLASTSSLRELCMSANHLGVEGARHIAQGLSGNTSLTSLELNRCAMCVCLCVCMCVYVCVCVCVNHERAAETEEKLAGCMPCLCVPCVLASSGS